MKHERFAVRQLSRLDAQSLFEYRDGMLYWRAAGSGRRRDLRAVTFSGKRAEINIGGERYQAHYVVWNWHNGKAKGFIRPNDGDLRNIAIENLREVDVFISADFPPPKHECPMCAQPVAAPTLDVITRKYELPPLQSRILKSIWSGGGHPVMPGKIFEAMYEGDIDGGPSDAEMYRAFKVALCRLRARIEGSGVSIETVGYRGGFRLVFSEDGK